MKVDGSRNGVGVRWIEQAPALLKYGPPLDGRWKQRSCDWGVGGTPLRMDLNLNAIDCSSPLLICIYATKTIPL